MRRLVDPAGSLASEPVELLAVVVVALSASAGTCFALTASRWSLGLLFLALIIPSSWERRVRTDRRLALDSDADRGFDTSRVIRGALCGVVIMLALAYLIFDVSSRAASVVIGAFYALIAPTSFVISTRGLSLEAGEISDTLRSR